MTERAPVELRTTAATTVATLDEALAFVVERVDETGATAPAIRITPRRTYGDGEDGRLDFEVAVDTFDEQPRRPVDTWRPA